jgi:hypothetical protein
MLPLTATSAEITFKQIVTGCTLMKVPMAERGAGVHVSKVKIKKQK